MQLDVFLHGGTLISVFVFYRRTILRIIMERDWQFVLKLILSAMPAVAVYFVFHKKIDALFEPAAEPAPLFAFPFQFFGRFRHQFFGGSQPQITPIRWPSVFFVSVGLVLGGALRMSGKKAMSLCVGHRGAGSLPEDGARLSLWICPSHERTCAPPASTCRRFLPNAAVSAA